LTVKCRDIRRFYQPSVLDNSSGSAGAFRLRLPLHRASDDGTPLTFEVLGRVVLKNQKTLCVQASNNLDMVLRLAAPNVEGHADKQGYEAPIHRCLVKEHPGASLTISWSGNLPSRQCDWWGACRVAVLHACSKSREAPRWQRQGALSGALG
jgi:hypothetical protein